MNIVCWQCGSVNRVPQERVTDRPVCGKCGQALLPSKPIELNDTNFDKYISRTDVPVLVDFWASWCGPCRMMAPEFETAAQQLSPHAILAKVDTDAAPNTAGRFQISGIPTLILFQGGREIARQSGAMKAAQIAAFVQSKTN